MVGQGFKIAIVIVVAIFLKVDDGAFLFLLPLFHLLQRFESKIVQCGYYSKFATKTLHILNKSTILALAITDIIHH